MVWRRRSATICSTRSPVARPYCSLIRPRPSRSRWKRAKGRPPRDDDTMASSSACRNCGCVGRPVRASWGSGGVDWCVTRSSDATRCACAESTRASNIISAACKPSASSTPPALSTMMGTARSSVSSAPWAPAHGSTISDSTAAVASTPAARARMPTAARRWLTGRWNAMQIARLAPASRISVPPTQLTKVCRSGRVSCSHGRVSMPSATASPTPSTAAASARRRRARGWAVAVNEVRGRAATHASSEAASITVKDARRAPVADRAGSRCRPAWASHSPDQSPVPSMTPHARRQIRRFATDAPPGRRVAASSAANVVSPALVHANSSSAIWKLLCMQAHSAWPRFHA